MVERMVYVGGCEVKGDLVRRENVVGWEIGRE